MKPVKSPDSIKPAMLGMVEGNGRLCSWSAIFNSYDRERMAAAPYPGIAEYLGRQPEEAFGIPGARVTHICCDNPADELMKIIIAGIRSREEGGRTLTLDEIAC